MTFVPPTMATRFAWTCGLAVLLAGLLAPSTASAGHCGRYIEDEARFRREIDRLLVDADSSDSLPTPTPPGPPCKGASCSAPPATPPAPLATATLIVEHWACPTGLIPLPSGSPARLHPDDSVGETIRRALAVFHPPRRADRSA